MGPARKGCPVARVYGAVMEPDLSKMSCTGRWLKGVAAGKIESKVPQRAGAELESLAGRPVRGRMPGPSETFLEGLGHP